MSALTEKQIAAYEAKGFKRWTKGDMDRLYIDATKLGLEVSYYKSGNVSGASWRGEGVSNSDGRRLLASKVWVDVKTGELNVRTSFEPHFTAEVQTTVEDAARELVSEIEAGLAEPEDGGAADDAKAREELTDAMRAAKYEPEARGEGFVVPGGEHDYYDGDFAEAVNRIPNATFWEVARILSGGETTTDALAAAICHARGVSVELVSE